MKKIILALALIAVVLISGCTEDDGDELPYKNDIITIEDFYASDKTPYEGSIIVIDFLLQNNGEEAVPRVEVGFNAPGFSILDLYCEGTTKRYDGEKQYCVFENGDDFNEIDPLDTRRVILTLRVMNIGILKPKVYTLSYYVEYDYSGFRKMDMPIIDGVTRKRPMEKYSQSSETYGPIKLSFSVPQTGESIEGDQVIKEYWGVRENPFEVTMKFTDVGSRSLGSIKEPVITEGDVRLDLRDSLKMAEVDGKPLHCDFEEDDGLIVSDKEVKVPGELVCSFQSVPFQDPETTATIWAYFDYIYRYTNSKDFNIQPLPHTATTEQTNGEPGPILTP